VHFTAAKGGGKEVLCCTAGTGVVFEHEGGSSGKQRFFQQHSAEITCVAVDPSLRFVATGQAGKKPIVLVWEMVRAGTAVIVLVLQL
jgi:hypothetical protein